MKKWGCISTGPSTHLDHLAPLAALFDMPLIVTEEEQLLLARKFYPMVTTEYIPLVELSLQRLALSFDVVFTCGKFWAVDLKPALELFFNKKMTFVFCPHGNSDKESFLHQRISQDIQLVYGPQMFRLQGKQRCIEIGNLRLLFYEEHKAHFDALSKERFFQDRNKDKKTVLYAPTWQTKASSTSFFESVERVIASLSPSYELLIKLHPLLEENDPARFYYFLAKYEKKVCFVLDFPPVYPLLEKTDIYLGDYSSIGYDFLYYDRPMYFLKEGGALQQAGEVLQEHFYVGDSQKALSKKRKELYLDAFGRKKNALKVKEEIFECLQDLAVLQTL